MASNDIPRASNALSLAIRGAGLPAYSDRIALINDGGKCRIAPITVGIFINHLM